MVSSDEKGVTLSGEKSMFQNLNGIELVFSIRLSMIQTPTQITTRSKHHGARFSANIPRSPHRSQGMQSDPTLYVPISESHICCCRSSSTASPKLLALLGEKGPGNRAK